MSRRIREAQPVAPAEWNLKPVRRFLVKPGGRNPPALEDAVHGACAHWLRRFIFTNKRDPFPQETWDAARAAALDGAIALVENMKPAGGRAWSEGQAACFLCLDDLSKYFKKQRAEPVAPSNALGAE